MQAYRTASTRRALLMLVSRANAFKGSFCPRMESQNEQVKFTE